MSDHPRHVFSEQGLSLLTSSTKNSIHPSQIHTTAPPLKVADVFAPAEHSHKTENRTGTRSSPRAK